MTTQQPLDLDTIDAKAAELRSRLDRKNPWPSDNESHWTTEGWKSGTRNALDKLHVEALVDEVRRLHAELAAARANTLREAAGVADGATNLFTDSDEGAAAAGALEGLAIRFRRMADAAQPPAEESHVVADDSDAPGTVHACPPDGSGLTPCCERTPFELSFTDRMSSDPTTVTCHPAARSAAV